ncbi:phosphotransferase enzyme family protein [Falsibacillus pallidus]|uniref:phosphotransferase enzyme family protein n=1 Tax=Falsibacillus pallidus TaxID=493781 RepID=UPI003D977036
MMKLSLMETMLHSEEHEQFIKNIVELWDGDAESASFIRASSTFIYSFKREDEKFILRLVPNDHESFVEREVNYLLYLHSNGLSVNRPVVSKRKRFTERAVSPAGPVIASVFTFCEGQLYEIDELSHQQFFLWGKALGHLHSFAATFAQDKILNSQPVLLSRLNHIEMSEAFEKVFAEEISFLRKWLVNKPMTRGSYGKIHFDFELDNLIWDGINVQMVDFESSIDGWYAADIAFALRDLFSDGVDLRDDRFIEFIKGYRVYHPITDKEFAEIPMFLRLHDLLLFEDLSQAVIENSEKNHPKWVDNLNQKLLNKMNDIRYRIGRVGRFNGFESEK